MKSCNTLLHVFTWIALASVFTSSSLFLFRVCGVYHDSMCAKCIFWVVWLTGLFGTLVIPFSLTAAPLPPWAGGLCVVASARRLSVIPSIAFGLFDLMVYIAISCRTINTHTMHTRWKRCRAFFTGEDMGPVYKALLRTGQIYFLYV